MNVLIIGATGYVGTAVDEALVARGHRTIGVARSDHARNILEARGTAVAFGDVAKPNSLTSAVKAADAVVFAVTVAASTGNVDVNALRSIRKTLAGTEKSFAYVSGVWVYGATGDTPATESAPLQPPPLIARRLELERETLAMTKLGIRAFVIRPGIAYGRGAGHPAMFVQSARERGASTIVGDGNNRWPTIHIDDLGSLIACAIEGGRPGRAYNAVGDDRFRVSQIAEAASRGAGAGGATTHVDPEVIGQFGDCLALDQVISAERAKTDLAWRPRGPSILEDLERGSYRAMALVP
jgi:nucleoside-diphosphate-sugar epimerase